MKRKSVIILGFLFVLSIPLFVFAHSQDGSGQYSIEDYIEHIWRVRCEIHGEVSMSILIPPDHIHFRAKPPKNDIEPFKAMDVDEQLATMRENSRHEMSEVLGFDVGYVEPTNIINICELCAVEEGRDIVRTIHDIFALN